MYGHRKGGPVKGVLAIENGTTVAARLVTRYVNDILGQRGRGDDPGGPEGDRRSGIFGVDQMSRVSRPIAGSF